MLSRVTLLVVSHGKGGATKCCVLHARLAGQMTNEGGQLMQSLQIDANLKLIFSRLRRAFGYPFLTKTRFLVVLELFSYGKNVNLEVLRLLCIPLMGK